MSFKTVSINKVLASKKKGNIALNSTSYKEALKHYTDALEMLIQTFNLNEQSGLQIGTFVRNSHQEACLYSKRSVALLKLNHYYFAYEDAKQTIEIAPEWFKGYLRKANVELHCGLFEKSLTNFQLALRYLSNETEPTKRENYTKFINQSINHVLYSMQRERIMNYQVPWIGAALGLVIGMALVAWDYISFGPRSYLFHPIFKLVTIGACSFLFFNLAKLMQTYNLRTKESYLKPPYSRTQPDADGLKID